MSRKTTQLWLLVIAIVLAPFVAFFAVREFYWLAWKPDAPKFVGKSEWPPQMQELLERYPGIAGSISTYKHDVWVDSKFAWRVSGRSAEIDQLVSDLKLHETTNEHAKYKELERSIPRSWALPKSEATKISVTKGYAVEWQEGTDLLLLVYDKETQEAIALYEWIF